MTYAQLKKPNLTIVGTAGFCLNYVRRVYGIGAKYPTAWTAWRNAKYKHATRTLPKASVPLWFSYYRLGVNYGHVAAYVPGKGVYSSPINGRRVFSSLAAFERAVPNCKYVGWSEDLNGVRIVKPTTTAPVYYVVKTGDTVSSICKEFGITIERFKQLNPQVSNINVIYPGQRVRVK